MKKILIYLIRFVIIFLLILPVLFPYVDSKVAHKTEQKIHIFVYAKQPDPKKMLMLKNKLYNGFGKSIAIDTIIYGNEKNTIIKDYDDLLSKINLTNDTIVVVSKANFFGEESERFNLILKKSIPFKENRLFFLNENILDSSKKEEYYLAISKLFIPKTVFVNSETVAIISIVGKAKPKTKVHLNIDLFSGNTFINSKEFNLDIPENGLVKENLEIPLQFYKIGSQSLTATLSATPSIASYPLKSAFTTVQVTYSKTTVLHVAFAPDWNLRLMRWKLKFWPNLDLLSYYILREINSDQTIPSKELSLIEFPSQKLFGDELAKLHGIIAQNFPFGIYLGQKESENLVQYVKNGGRFVIQSGAFSFEGDSDLMEDLSPCKNKPKLDIKNKYHWIVKNKNISFPSEYVDSLNHIVSENTLIGCIPKDNALVLAQLEETKDPVLLAMPLEKGIVVAFLGSDWLSGYTMELPEQNKNQYARMEFANASDAIFQWMIEFLQRRQDSGVRAPELMGPRIYSEDKYLAVKPNGPFNLKQTLLVQTNNGNNISSRPLILKNLKTELLELKRPLKSIVEDQKQEGAPNLEELTVNPTEQNEQLTNFKSVPIFHGAGKDLEKNSNPFLFDGIESVDHLNLVKSEKVDNLLNKNNPLIQSYPWLLALVLGLLALEQFLSRVLL